MDRLKRFNEEEKELKRKFGLNTCYKSLRPLYAKKFFIHSKRELKNESRYYMINNKREKLVVVHEPAYIDGHETVYNERYLVAIPGTLWAKWILGQLKGY